MNVYLLNTDFAVHMRFGDHAMDEAPPISITFGVLPGQWNNMAMGLYTRIETKRPSPAAELILSIEDFDIDYFAWCGSIFVSKRMRDIMALDPSEAQFFEIDDSNCAPLPRSKNYQIMEPDIAEEMADLEKLDYEMVRYAPDMPLVPKLRGPFAVRADATPEHDLFYDSVFSEKLLCTEAFALRVLKAGCTGMRFEVANGKVRGLYRTLRGIEEEVEWDKVNGVAITQVVQAIDPDQTVT